MSDGPKVFIVYESDGTAFTGRPWIIGASLNKQTADEMADAVKQRNSWNHGSVREVPLS